MWSACKLVLLWDINTVKQLLMLPNRWADKAWDNLTAVPTYNHTFSICKWHFLLALMCSITPVVTGERGVFTGLKCALTLAKGGRIALSEAFNDELNVW